MLEVSDLKDLTFDEYTALKSEVVLFTEVGILDSRFKRPYLLRFFDTHYFVDTEKRGRFLELGTEQEAQDALIDITLRIRKHTGGQFDIHPFYGAVNGTKINPVAPSFSSLEGMDNVLECFIWVSRLEQEFDPSLTQIAHRLGDTIDVPSPEAGVFSWYLRATDKANPNQRNRDQARVNGLERAWEEQFQRFNTGDIPQAIQLTPSSVAQLLRELNSEGIEDPRIVNTRVRR